jgi:hypothetical protein
MTDQTTAPLADALAGVDHASGTAGNPWNDPARELAALRDLRDAARLFLLGSAAPEQAEPEGTPTVADWLDVVDSNRAELLRVQGEFGESDVSSERDAYLGALENLASAVRDHLAPQPVSVPEPAKQPGQPEMAGPEKVYGGYTHGQLTEAFALVKNPDNWKLPIAATVPADADRAAISAAVVFFTGSMAEFIPGRRGLHVGAAGYYAAIGS